jgi:ketosteroid isomerase-like protein
MRKPSKPPGCRSKTLTPTPEPAGYCAAMSRENVEAFKRGIEAGNRGDIETLLEELHPEVEWHSALHALMGGEQTVFRGHDGVREMIRDLYEAFHQIHIEISEIRDLGDRLVAIGRNHARGEASGADVETPFGFVTEFKNGKAISIRGYLDHKEALEAVGLSERGAHAD